MTMTQNLENTAYAILTSTGHMSHPDEITETWTMIAREGGELVEWTMVLTPSAAAQVEQARPDWSVRITA